MSGLATKTESHIFHSGTTLINDEVVTNGGRVFAVTSFGKSIKEAVDKSMATAQLINYDKKYYRNDIGQDLMKLESVI